MFLEHYMNNMREGEEGEEGAQTNKEAKNNREIVIDAANELHFVIEEVKDTNTKNNPNHCHSTNKSSECDDSSFDSGMLDEGDIPLRAQRIMREHFETSLSDADNVYGGDAVVTEEYSTGIDDRSYDDIEQF